MDKNELNISTSQDARITRYLKGQMSADEEKVFISDLDADATLKSRAITIARMIKAMNKVGTEKDNDVIAALDAESDITPYFTDKTASRTGQKKPIFARQLIITLSVAASLIICLMVGYRIYDNRQMTALSEEYLPYFPASEYARGEQNTIAAEIASLYQHVLSNEDLDDVISRLDELWIESQSDTYNDCTAYSPEIGWILANAYIRNNDKDKAIATLDILIRQNTPGSAMAQKANELRQKVKDRKIIPYIS